MKVVLTGSESFIGREFAKLCGQDGFELIGIDSVASDRSGHHQLDIRSPEVARVVPQGSDALVHLAAISTDAACQRDPQLAFEVNVGGTINLIRASLARGVRQFVFASSEWVYGDVSNAAVQTEDSPIDITKLSSAYALTKIVGERLLSSAHGKGLPSVTILRFGIVYGPRPSNWSAVESLFHAVQTQEVVEVKGSLRTGRRYVHVADVANGIRAALGAPGLDVFNLSGDDMVTLGDVIQESAAVLGRRPQVVERDPSAIVVRNPDNSKARKKLGWRPAIKLSDGLKTLMPPLVELT